MRALILLAFPLFATLPGCTPFSFSSPPRSSSYQIDVRNASSSPISVEFLRIESARVSKTRCDLTPGGFYTTTFTSLAPEYLEARLCFTDHPSTLHPAAWIVQLKEGHTQADIILAHDHLTLQARTDPASK